MADDPRLQEIHSILNDLYGKVDVHEWLILPVPALSGRRPVDLIEEGNYDAVLQVLHAIADGTYL